MCNADDVPFACYYLDDCPQEFTGSRADCVELSQRLPTFHRKVSLLIRLGYSALINSNDMCGVAGIGSIDFGVHTFRKDIEL